MMSHKRAAQTPPATRELTETTGKTRDMSASAFDEGPRRRRFSHNLAGYEFDFSMNRAKRIVAEVR
jgi:hypothetical protein